MKYIKSFNESKTDALSRNRDIYREKIDEYLIENPIITTNGDYTELLTIGVSDEISYYVSLIFNQDEHIFISDNKNEYFLKGKLDETGVSNLRGLFNRIYNVYQISEDNKRKIEARLLNIIKNNSVKNLPSFNKFLNESSQTHYFGVDSETEKRAGLSGFYSGPSRFTSKDTLVRRVKKYFLKPEVLAKLSDGKVRVTVNSKSSFHILTTTKFYMLAIEKDLTEFGERFMKMEGPLSVDFELITPNDIFVSLDQSKGVNIRYK